MTADTGWCRMSGVRVLHQTCSDEAARIVCRFFFQAEDGIRDLTVTGVQTCALPIYVVDCRCHVHPLGGATEVQLVAERQEDADLAQLDSRPHREEMLRGEMSHPPLITQIGRASCRERV